MRKFRLYDNAKAKYIDLNNQNNFAKNWQGLGLNNDLAFTNSDNGEYLDNLKVANKDIKSIISFNGYSYYDKFKSFILSNGKNNFILEYLSHTDYKTQEEITLKDETFEVENGDDEYFVHVPLISKYLLKPETVPFTETPSYPDINYKNYAEVKLIQGATTEVNALLESVTNPLVKIVNENLLSVNSKDFTNALALVEDITNEIKPSTTYSLSTLINALNSTSGAYRIRVNFDSTTYFSGTAVVYGNKDISKVTFTTPSSFTSALVEMQPYNTPDSTVKNATEIMLNTGTSPLPYLAHESTQAQFMGTYRQFDSLKVVNGVYKKDNGSTLPINLWEYGDITSVSKTITYRFSLNNFMANYDIVDTDKCLNAFTYIYSDTDERHWKFLNGNLYIYVEQSIIDARSEATLEDKFKAYLQSIICQFVGQKATVTVEDVVVDGGLDLIPDGNIFVSDDNNLLTSATLQYKRWNLSNIIRKTNLKKFTISGDYLIIYLLASDVDNLTGATIIDKIITYFKMNESYVNILLNAYVKTETYKYRDVYLRELSKGEKNTYGQIESNFILTPNKGWYIEHSTDYNVPLTVADSTNAFLQVSIDGLNSRSPMIIKLSSPSLEYKPKITIDGTDFDTNKFRSSQILFDASINYFTNGEILTIDALKRKITLYNGVTLTEDNYYDYIDKRYDSFPYIFSRGVTIIFQSSVAVTTDTTVSITITYREWV